MTSSCKWPINRTSNDKYCDLFSFFFLARLKISVDSRNYNLCVESMPETDFGIPDMTQIMARPACQRIWHAGHEREFGMPGTPENLACPACRRFWHAGHAGYELLLLEPRLLAAWVNLKLCLQGTRNSVACQFQCKTTLDNPLYYQWANHWR